MTSYITRELKCTHKLVKCIWETGSTSENPGDMIIYDLHLELNNGEVITFSDYFPYQAQAQAEKYLQTL